MIRLDEGYLDISFDEGGGMAGKVTTVIGISDDWPKMHGWGCGIYFEDDRDYLG